MKRPLDSNKSILFALLTHISAARNPREPLETTTGLTQIVLIRDARLTLCT